ncbi:hypothetical protein BDZ89DRAFT_1153540 [Hymenopellis radicata]|nr:hypothetical protein BDZ89DRAFT_1153540 [Hymenopellis radicata]
MQAVYLSNSTPVQASVLEAIHFQCLILPQDKLEQEGFSHGTPMEISQAAMADQFEAFKAKISTEHMHDSNENRYVLQVGGSASLDLRYESAGDSDWIRVTLTPGKLVMVPAGLYHRVVLEAEGSITLVTCVQNSTNIPEEPAFHPRNPDTDNRPARKAYLQTI